MKNKSLLIVTLFLIIFPLILSSCLKKDDPEQKELDRLKEYIKDHDITVKPTESGLYIITEKEGTGLSPVNEDYVDVDYTLEKLDDESPVITTDSTIAKDNDIYSSILNYGPERLLIGGNIRGFDEGLKTMKEGGEATLIMPSKLAWGASTYPLGAYTSAIFKVKLLRVLSNPAAYEQSLIQQFLAENQFSTDSTDSGIYVIQIQAGSTDTTNFDRMMTMNIKGSLMGGTVFFPQKEVRTVISTSESSLFTEGLKEGIHNMTIGEKAIILVPYYQGYSANGKYQDTDGAIKLPIPSFSALKYEVEITAIN